MDEKKLTIYFTSDLHGYIYPTDYRGQGEKELGAVQVRQPLPQGR